MAMHVIKVDGTVTTTLDKDSCTLEEVQGIVGGYIEPVPLFVTWEGEPCQVWCDEEGKVKRKAINQKATEEWYDAVGAIVGNDVLVGDICILTGKSMLR
jgi:hypothetical protein